MQPIETAPSLTEQVYAAILAEICDGSLKAGEHLKQERLAARLSVSRQPVQQAMALLKADGMVEEIGTRGLRVTALDPALVRHHYAIRGVLDGYAARLAAGRAAADPTLAREFAARGREILAAGRASIGSASVAEQVAEDEALHRQIFDWSGNPLLARTAEPHWRYLRRAMGDVLRHAEPARSIWDQHASILDAIAAGDAARAEAAAADHAERAAKLLAAALEDITASN